MSIGDCLAKLKIDPSHEEAILKGVDVLTREKRMSEAVAAKRVLMDQLDAADAELKDYVSQIEAKGTADHVALANHIAKHGEIDTRAVRVSKPVAEQKPIAVKEPTEHVQDSGLRRVRDAVKDLIDGGSAAEGVLNRLTKRDNPKEMQAYIDTINDSKAKGEQLVNANIAIERLNKAMAESLKKSPDAAYELQLKKDVRSSDPGQTVSQAAREHVEKYINTVLGGKVKLLWDNIMHAGEFAYTKGQGKIDSTYAIRVSVHALDPQGTAYHESLHAFFAMLREQKNHAITKVLYRAAETAPVMNQLRRLLKDEPAALKQIETNREERVAYMYQFYAKDMLTLGTDSKNVMGRLKDFFLKTLGIWTNDQRAAHIMEWFNEGNFNPGDRNATSRALMEPGRNQAVEWIKGAIDPLKKLEKIVIGTGDARMRDTDNPAFIKIADLMRPHDVSSGDPGFIQASSTNSRTTLNGWARDLKGLSQDELFAAHEALKRGEKGSTPGEQRAVAATRKLLDTMYDYMQTAGVKVRDLGYGKDYFPRIWDAEYISKNQDAFRAMMAKYETSGQFKGNVERAISHLMARDGSELGVVVDMPGMQHTKERKLDFITPEDAAPFLQKNIFSTINSYVTQASRRAEWARRFGDDGKGMRDLLKEAETEHGATQSEVDMAQDYIHGIDGTLGDDISPTARRLMGNMIVYQNVRLLPLAIFSSLIDPGGIVVRGGTVKDAWSAFKRGITEIPQGFKKNAPDDLAYKLAQDIGAIDDTSLVHALGSSYTQGMVAEGARKWNDAFFKFNLMEQFNTSMRVSATEAAVRFVARHSEGEGPHSQRWLTELGLAPKDVILKDGRPLIRQEEFEAHGMSPEAAAAASNKMKGALNRWVDGAVLRPNAVDKPIWMNDPRWALIAHLKQFTYAFQNTILKRAWHEAEHGNYGPAVALAGYVPMMMASDFAKGLIQGGGQQPDWKKGWGVDDYVASGVQRAGLLGVSQYSSDIMKSVRRGGTGIGTIMGPSFEQMGEAIQTLAGHEMYKTMAFHSLPANALYSHAFHSPATDPNFAE